MEKKDIIIKVQDYAIRQLKKENEHLKYKCKQYNMYLSKILSEVKSETWKNRNKNKNII